jgi:hypothetical protein
MKAMRKIFTLATAVVVASALMAGPAAAKGPKDPKGGFDYVATIDCGSGPMEVGSGVDLWSTFVDLDTGKKYKPVAWHVSGDGFAVDELKKGEPKKHAVECSYSDGVATGTVTVKKA